MKLKKNAVNDGTSTGLEGLLTPMTNVRLKDSILDNFRNPSNEKFLRATNALSKIKLELMQEYGKHLAGACEDKPIKPSRTFITDLHRVVFKKMEQILVFFWGDTVDNNIFLDFAIRKLGGYDWCPNCSK